MCHFALECVFCYSKKVHLKCFLKQSAENRIIQNQVTAICYILLTAGNIAFLCHSDSKEHFKIQCNYYKCLKICRLGHMT